MSSVTTTLVHATGLNTHYGQRHILRGIDFEVLPGQTIGLMGRNGMGKSTLLKSLMGLVKPSSGQVHIKGQDMTGAAPFEVARKGIAYVPEGRGIFGNLSVKENLLMAARAGTQGQREWTYERVLDTFPRLKERLGHGGQQLSGGEQQMLAVARALVLNPKLLLLDEPLEGLAPIIVEELLRAIARITREEGLSAIIVEQHPQAILAISHRAVVLAHGTVVHASDADTLRQQPELLDRLLGVSRH